MFGQATAQTINFQHWDLECSRVLARNELGSIRMRFKSINVRKLAV